LVIDSFSKQYRFLSNFYPCKIWFEGLLYPSTEHAYQAAKTLDMQERIRISKLPVADAKKAGNKIKIRDDWEEIKISVMVQLIDMKFNIQLFAEKLLATGEAELIEGNWWNDVFWGVCKGVGKNMLGIILMEKRDRLKEELLK
jgi:ribA/ribD-fused uncharacterized protein